MKKVILVFIGLLAISTLFNHCCEKKTPCLPPLSKSPCAQELAAINHDIPVAEAQAMIDLFQSSESAILSGAYRDSVDLFPNSESFNRDAIYDLLKRDSVAGLRISLGLTSDKKLRLVLTPVIPPCDVLFPQGKPGSPNRPSMPSSVGKALETGMIP